MIDGRRLGWGGFGGEVWRGWEVRMVNGWYRKKLVGEEGVRGG